MRFSIPLPRNLLEIALFCFPAIVLAQPFTRVIEGIPVTVNGNQLAQPFAGGINAPNHQFVDIDGDNDLDLFILDNDLYLDFYRNGGSSSVANFKLRPHDIAMPPFQFWFLFVDLNGDGLIDLCTDDSGSGISYYQNEGSKQDPDFILHTKTMIDSAGDAVFAGFSSIPSFTDLNGDSLIDFLSSNSINGSINYYQNIGTKSSPLFKFISAEYQGITVIGDTCFFSSVKPKQNAHGTGAYFFADINGNGTPDMFYGDLFSHSVFLMQNEGSPTQPQLQCTSNNYPANNPMYTYGFNQPTFVDIDGDGDLDMINGVLNNMQRHGFWYYRNEGSATAPDFQFKTKDFLSVIDAGSYVHPVFIDIENDNDLDLITGNLDGQLWLFRNNGTPAMPSFALDDTAFGGVVGNYTYAPAFVDIDHDGDKDLFVGRFDGKIKFYRNTGCNCVSQFVGEVFLTDTISVGQNAVPFFTDIDGDGDADLFVGKANGQINFYRNDGSDTNFIPNLISTAYLGIALGENAKPVFADIDHDSDSDLFVGSTKGTIEFYENTGSATVPQFTFRTNHYAGTDPMKEADPAFADIDNDGDLDLFTGTSKGGLQFYRNDLITGIESIQQLPNRIALMRNYPNPFNPATNFEIRNPKPEIVSLCIYDLLGRNIATIYQGELQPGVHIISWDAVNFSSGVYYARLTSKDYLTTQKILLTK